MMLTWKPSLDDLRSEVQSVGSLVADAGFNCDFGHKMQTAKLRLCALEDRLKELERMQRLEANALRHDIDASMQYFLREVSEIRSAIGDVRLLKADRGRANHLHTIDLKRRAQAAELSGEGGEA